MDLGRLSPEEFARQSKLPVMVLLDNIRSGLNVGSIFRSADAFLIEQVGCCGYTPQPPHREVLKTALGATEVVPWKAYPDTLECIRELKSQGTTVLAIEQVSGSMPLHTFCPSENQKYALVFGNEVFGVGQEVIDACDGVLEITQWGTKHSLNVAVSAGIVLHHMAIRLNENLKTR